MKKSFFCVGFEKFHSNFAISLFLLKIGNNNKIENTLRCIWGTSACAGVPKYENTSEGKCKRRNEAPAQGRECVRARPRAWCRGRRGVAGSQNAGVPWCRKPTSYRTPASRAARRSLRPPLSRLALARCSGVSASIIP